MNNTIHKTIRKTEKEFIDIMRAIDDNINDDIILDSYDHFSKSMLNFIKSKDDAWFILLFSMIRHIIKQYNTPELLLYYLSDIPNVNKNIINYIVNSI